MYNYDQLIPYMQILCSHKFYNYHSKKRVLNGSDSGHSKINAETSELKVGGYIDYS